jgi:ABC-2 type transport system ATP-binding protein
MTVLFTTHYLEEAEDVADRIAIIDHGKIVAIGTVGELTQQTKTTSLEDAYLALTGKTIREEKGEKNLSFKNAMRRRNR